jgi:hypothetical protein
MMVLDTFREFARRRGHEVLYLDIVGGPQVWGADPDSPPWMQNLSKEVKAWVAGTLRPRIRSGHPWFAPWMMYIGRKP